MAPIQIIFKQYPYPTAFHFILVFPSKIETPMGLRRLFGSYKQLLKQAGLPDCRLHDLRHTIATIMQGWGIHPKVVQERLGYACISHTSGIYSHVLPSIQMEAAEKMDELILRKGGRIQYRILRTAKLGGCQKN